jgi:LPXTG-motif cell wall-anchored protein
MLAGTEEEKSIPFEDGYATLANAAKKAPAKNTEIVFATLGALGLLSLAGFSRKRKNHFRGN